VCGSVSKVFGGGRGSWSVFWWRWGGSGEVEISDFNMEGATKRAENIHRWRSKSRPRSVREEKLMLTQPPFGAKKQLK
jgi:hypothetical protein